MTTYPLGITGVTPFAYFPPVGNVDDVVGGTWTESGNALTGYSGSAGGVYVGANADVTGVPAMPDPWVQPTGAADAYKTGDRVTFEDNVWESVIDANVWSPTGYPAGWKKV